MYVFSLKRKIGRHLIDEFSFYYVNLASANTTLDTTQEFPEHSTTPPPQVRQCNVNNQTKKEED